MPSRVYRHYCRADNDRLVESGSRWCWGCWRSTEFHQWQWGVIESWWRFNKRTGLNPLEPKPPELLERQITRVCGTCNGRGLLPGGEKMYRLCKQCGGAGGFPVLSAAELAWARQFAAEERRRRSEAARDRVQARAAAREREWQEAVAAARARQSSAEPRSGED
jgi:hypothetical protein